MTQLLADFQIKDLVLNNKMIMNFAENGKRHGKISFGLSSFGYDARLGYDFKCFECDDVNQIIDPKEFDPRLVISYMNYTDPFVIPPHGVVLGLSYERFKIPNDVMVLCIGKSTYARCGIIVNVTPLEPGWEGHVTLEIHNTTDYRARIYPGEGICQFLFFQSLVRPLVTYSSKNGKYQSATGIDTPKVD